MAYTFKKVLGGMAIGSSLFDPEGAKIVAELAELAKARGVKLTFPVDYVCADKFDPQAQTRPADDASGIPDGWMGLDVGPKSIGLFRESILRARTIVWNGPPGVFEFDKFAGSTKAMAEAVAEATARGAVTVIGGGDTATAAKKFKVAGKVTHCSTGRRRQPRIPRGQGASRGGVPRNLKTSARSPCTCKKLIAGNWKMNKTAADAVVPGPGPRRPLVGKQNDVDVVDLPALHRP